jgi:hypothetical protein
MVVGVRNQPKTLTVRFEFPLVEAAPEIILL